MPHYRLSNTVPGIFYIKGQINFHNFPQRNCPTQILVLLGLIEIKEHG